MSWAQNYDPFGATWISAAVAAAPVVVMLGALAFFHVRAHIAALLGLAAAFLVAVIAFGMPTGLAIRSAGFGAAYGLLPIGWIVLNIIFLYQLTHESGQFEILRHSIARITDDSRLQLLLIAFCFGAFFEGAAGFGTPIAVTGAMLIGLGFTRLQASGLSLIANTAPVAFGALGTPLITLAAITDLPLLDLSAMTGRIMVLFSFIVPWWLLIAYCGWRRTREVWPAILVTASVFSLTQFVIANLHGPWLAAVGSALASIVALVLFLRVWQPANIMHVTEAPRSKADLAAPPPEAGEVAEAISAEASPCHWRVVAKAWMPWLILTSVVFLWGIPATRALLDGLFAAKLPIAGLDGAVLRMPPVVSAGQAEKAVYSLNILSATGTAILLAGVLSGLLLGMGPRQLAGTYGRAFRMVTPSLLTISAMLALGYVTRYSGIDAAMGLAFARSRVFYPFFGSLLGWLGVAVTGSDTASNVLFGGLQKITAAQLGLSPILMAAANSAGGVMGKMIDAQSIVVASTATRWFGAEGTILRYVFVHSIILASLLGALVMLFAYVPPFTGFLVGN